MAARIELTCDRCGHAKTSVDVDRPELIEHWIGGATGQHFTLEAQQTPVGWWFFFDVQRTVLLSCPDCTARKGKPR